MARLSPAASLLRNSKLFSLPPTLALPAQEASSETLARSDTATTPYPIRAAIETPQLSLNKGDWGLKRSLPLKTTTKTGTPVIRVQRGLDTPEHTVDFESAADHVLTLQKWQHLHMPVQYSSGVNTGYDDKHKHGVFNPSDDNTTNISNKNWTGVWPSIAPKDRALHVPKGPKDEGAAYMTAKIEEHELSGAPLPVVHERPVQEKKPDKRWRYRGPWLAGMSGMEFDEFLKKQVRTRTKDFRERVELQWLADKEAASRARALEQGTLGLPVKHAEVQEETKSQIHVGEKPKALTQERTQITDEEFETYVRALRRRPQIFGPLIADFLDLPDGPKPPTANLASRKELWEYGRDTVAAPSYRNTGPPRTHPSAGLSYSRSRNWAANDATFGPQNDLTPVVGRILKVIRSGSNPSATVGVAGFVTPRMDRGSSRGNNDFSGFTPRPGGQKLLVVPNAAMVNVEGMLDLHVRHAPDTHVLENDEAVRQEARKLPETASYGEKVPQLDTNYKKADPLPRGFSTTRGNTNQEDDPAAVLDLLNKMQREK